MTVTKQQQLEYLAKECNSWRGRDFILASDTELGYRLPVSSGCHMITREEWQQERDKMSSRPEVGNSWHERGEFPPVGCECDIRHSCGNSEKYEKVTVAAITSEYVIVKYATFEQHYMLKDVSFRPIRTEREKAIDEMLLAVDHIKEGNFETFIGALYDAGYRKVKP